MHHLQAQLVHAEDSFLASLSSGPTAIQAFSLTFSDLQVAFDKEMKKNSIDDETMAAFYQTVTRIEIISRRFVEHFEHADALAASLRDDLDAIFANLVLDDVSSSNLGSAEKLSVPNASPAATLPYIEPAYSWLLKNLHNPYPSKGTKSSIALETSSSLKDLDNWFISVRKRIGWNKLRLKHYGNKRSRIVAAATHFFKEVPQSLHHQPYISMANHDSEFKAIEICAKELYSDKLLETPLEKKLTSKTKSHTQTEERRRQVVKSRKAKDLQRLDAYPSPEHSPERSPEPIATSLPVLDATPATSRKRRNCDRDSPELDVEDRRDEPQKRSRLDSYHFSRDLAVASLPSPAASFSDITRENSATPSDQGSSENDCIILPTPPIPAAPSGKRKRRLSDTGHDSLSKRPHNSLAVPRLQTVSDPLPLANPIISDLYKPVFCQTISDSIPAPVSVESLNESQVEVDFYNYDASPDIMQSFSLADSSLGPYPTVPSLLSTANSKSLLSLGKSQVSDPSLDFLFCLNTPPQATDIPFFADIPSHDLSALFPFENMLPPQPPQEDILSNSYFQIPGLWDFQGNGDSFSTIVPSIGTLFSNNSVPPQIDSTQNEREAKRKQIEALRAQIQSLEAEP